MAPAAGPSFRIFGIPVRVDPTFLVIAALLGFGIGNIALLLTWVVVVFVSVLLHELGHAVAFRAYGQQPRVLLAGMGGLTSGSGPLSSGREIVVSLAGPLTGLVVLGLPALWLDRAVLDLTPTWHTVVREVLFVNVVWSGVNLLPVLPLDGGQVSASLLTGVFGPSGWRAARIVSIVVAGGAALFAYSVGYPFGALFAAFFVGTNWSELRREQASGRQAPLVKGYQALMAGDLDGARATADRVLAASPHPETVASAVELRAWALLGASDAATATAALADLPPGATPNRFLAGSLALEAGRTDDGLGALVEGYVRRQFGPWSGIVAESLARPGLVDELVDRLLATPGAGVDAVVALQSHLYLAGRFTESASVGALAFAARPSDRARVAYDVACGWARAGDGDAALQWLERAADAGFDDGAYLDADRDLEPLRATDRYRAVRGRIAARG
jgi:Zn-dependent protease